MLPKNKYIYPKLDVVFFVKLDFLILIFVIPTESVLLFFFFKKVYLEIKSDGKFIFKIPILSLSLIKYGHISPIQPYVSFQYPSRLD